VSDLLYVACDGALAVGASSILYASTVALAALTAVYAQDRKRRRSARDVLKILLRTPR
jgi:hypothetical protein